MLEQAIESELQKRLDIIASPDYQSHDLTKMDYFYLFIGGIVIPIILMFWGWIIK